MQADPVFMRRLNGWLTMFWVAMIPVPIELGWLKSVTYRRDSTMPTTRLGSVLARQCLVCDGLGGTDRVGVNVVSVMLDARARRPVWPSPRLE